jgi:hypothetical protein
MAPLRELRHCNELVDVKHVCRFLTKCKTNLAVSGSSGLEVVSRSYRCVVLYSTFLFQGLVPSNEIV